MFYKKLPPVELLHEEFVASRIIWCIMTGEDPKNCEIDHIDQNPLNDKWQNLRKLQPVQNKWNKPKYQNNMTGFKGVSVRKNQKGVQYWARISARQIRYYDGPYPSATAAAAAYAKLSRQHHEKYGAPQ